MRVIDAWPRILSGECFRRLSGWLRRPPVKRVAAQLTTGGSHAPKPELSRK
jgi:hypothetical protein